MAGTQDIFFTDSFLLLFTLLSAGTAHIQNNVLPRVHTNKIPTFKRKMSSWSIDWTIRRWKYTDTKVKTFSVWYLRYPHLLHPALMLSLFGPVGRNTLICLWREINHKLTEDVFLFYYNKEDFNWKGKPEDHLLNIKQIESKTSRGYLVVRGIKDINQSE